VRPTDARVRSPQIFRELQLAYFGDVEICQFENGQTSDCTGIQAKRFGISHAALQPDPRYARR
jgi:hypothetical protein